MPVIGLVGCGNWGRNILRDLKSLGCDVHVGTRGQDSQQLARDMGAVSVSGSAGELPECDGYVLAVPIDDLAPVALELLPLGKPIFSEKTLCPTMVQAQALKEAGADGQVFVMHKWEYHKGIRKLREIATSGRIGELEQIRCRREGWTDPHRIPDALTLLAIHDLTIVRHILGSFPTPEYALINYQGEVPISLNAVLGSGPRAVLSIDSRHPENCRAVTLMGSRGAAHLGGAYATEILVRDGKGEEKVPFERNMPLLDELEEFVAYLGGGPKPRCGFDHAFDAAMALDAIRQCDEGR